MEIRKLNMQQLVDLIHSNETNTWSAVPISKFRLLSQSKNPFLQPEDIVMILAIENNDLAGYLGSVPDNISWQGGKEHVSWGSCIWVNPAKRRSGVARTLFQEMINSWKGKFIATEFAPESGAVLKSMNVFSTLLEKTGMRFFFRSIFYPIASQRTSKLPAMVPMLRGVDFLINLVLDMGLKSFSKRKKASARFRDVNLRDAGFWKSSKSPFEHTREKWEWLVTYPWLTNDPIETESRYYFATFVKRFKAGAAEILNDTGDIIGQLVYTIYDNNMKLIDVSFTGNRKEELIFVEAIVSFVSRNRIDTLLSYSAEFNDIFGRRGMLYFLKKKRTREYLVPKSLAAQLQLETPLIEEYDGDVFFT